MKKLPFIAFGLFLTLVGCSSSGSSAPVAPVVPAQSTFMSDGKTYSLPAQNGISELQMKNILTTPNGTKYDRSAITIIGSTGTSEITTFHFDLFYKNNQTIAGTYTIFDTRASNASFEDYIQPLNRACLGWTSAGVTTQVQNASGNRLDFNNPVGVITIVVNSPANYTIQYSNNFRVYDSNSVFSRNVPIILNLTGDVLIN